jgi:hypothetical protein
MTNQEHDKLVEQCRDNLDARMTPERFDENGWRIIEGSIYAPCGCVGSAPIQFIPPDPMVFPSNERLLFGGFRDCGKNVDYHGGTGCVFCEKDRAKSFAVGIPYNREVWAWLQTKTGMPLKVQ